MEIRSVIIDTSEQIRIGEVRSGTNNLPPVVFADCDGSFGILGLECHRGDDECQIGARTRGRFKAKSLSEQRNTAENRYLVGAGRIVDGDKAAQDQTIAAGNPREVYQVGFVDDRIIVRRDNRGSGRRRNGADLSRYGSIDL